ncbi:L,D-transpeptidase family protein [bacterium]|nr:L,D-transpeptidase family protein [bacterium]
MNFSKFLCTVFLTCSLLGVAQADTTWREVVGTDRTHVVSYGENLYSIAQKYGLAIEHLAFANHRDPNNINVSVGTSLIIPGRRVLPKNPPTNGLVVNLPERGVYLFRDNHFEKFYPVAIGQSGRFQTPMGNFTIVSRTKDPTWFPPEWANMGEEPVPAGPNNPLGDRWIGLSAPGVGLHSTTSPMSIGQAVSHGCMRMYPSSVHELFDKVVVGWPVRIEYETAKAGYNYKDGRYYVVSFPDVYGLAPTKSSMNKTLEEVGLSVDDKDLNYLASSDGVTKEIEIAGVNIVVGKEKLNSWPIDPMMIEGAIWASPKVASAIGLDVSWDNVEQAVKVGRNKTILYYPINADFVIDSRNIPLGYTADVAGYARKIDGKTIIPLRSVLTTFGVPNSWDGANRTLTISTLPRFKSGKKVEKIQQVETDKETDETQIKNETETTEESEVLVIPAPIDLEAIEK